MVHGCMVYTERAETAAVSRSTSHVTTKQRCEYTTWVDIQKRTIITPLELHASAVGLLKSG